jgi:hypothetical protein
MTSKSSLQKIFQGIWYTENENKQYHEMTGSTKQEKKRQGIRE